MFMSESEAFGHVRVQSYDSPMFESEVSKNLVSVSESASDMDSDTNSSEGVSVSVHPWSIYVWNLWKWIFRQSCYDSILSAVRSPDSVRNFVKMFPDVCLSILCLDPVWCLDSARILETVCCLFVRSDKDEAELSGLSLSLFADVI